jgi:hypothetical protein
MRLTMGYLAANRVHEPGLLRDMADQLPEPMRSLCAGLDYDAAAESPAFLASLDAALPDTLRRRFRRADLEAMGITERGIRYHLTPDGRDTEGNWWFYATIIRYMDTRKGRP